MAQTAKVPARRNKWLCPDIDNRMNELYRDLMLMSDSYFRNKNDKRSFAAELAKPTIGKLNALEKPLMVLWNVQKSEVNTMAGLVSKIKWEVSLLNQMHNEEDVKCTVSILDWRAINNANFMRNMSDLHRYTHGKVANAYKVYDGTQGALLISIVNDAFYELVLANKSIPTTKAEYEQRRQHISNAITYLKEMNRPMLFYFNLMQYSERVMNEWVKLLSDELKMLTALQKSDKDRFKSLT